MAIVWLVWEYLASSGVQAVKVLAARLFSYRFGDIDVGPRNMHVISFAGVDGLG